MQRTYLQDLAAAREVMLARDVDEPLAGTNITLYPDIAQFWLETYGVSAIHISPESARKIWAAERCIQLNAQQIASMPVRFHSTAPQGGYEPAWIGNPDPAWFPNGIGDALFAIVRSIYGYGYALCWITARYASGFPSAWTVLDPRAVEIKLLRGRRAYFFRGTEEQIPSVDIVQIDRDPGHELHGRSALSAFASLAYGLASSGELSRSFLQGGVPQTVLKPQIRQTAEQAAALQAQWVAATQNRGGAPPVLDPRVDFEVLSLSPNDLALLESQEFTARVVAAAYGVPAHFLNIPLEGGLTYQNPAMLGEQWWRFELRPTAKRIADAWSAQMLPAGNWVTLDASDTFAPIVSELDDPQKAGSVAVDVPPVAAASPSDADGNTVVPIRGMGG